jgi:hypothetical protein
MWKARIQWLLLGLALASALTLTASETIVFGPTAGLAAVSALNATHTAHGAGLMTRARECAVYVNWGTGVTSGAVTVESAMDLNYSGTWGQLAVVTFAGTAPKADIVQITGIAGALRSRISTVLAGGTVDTWALCN